MTVADQTPQGYEPHIGESRQYWRDIILGVNDGLVSIFLLVVGVASGGLDKEAIVLTAVAGAIAGAVSMAAGEYLATKSQDEVLEAELQLERTHIRDFRDMEVAQLRDYFTEMGIRAEDLDSVIAAFEDNDEAILNAMAALEFGVIDSERRSPFMAMFASGGLFLVGSLPSILPFLFVESVAVGVIIATVLALAGLFIVGIVKARVAKTSWLKSGLENLVVAGVGGVVAWGIGRLFNTTIT